MKDRSDNNETIFTIPFAECGKNDVALVGGKNSSLGEMISQLKTRGVSVPDGFAITVNLYWDYIHANNLKQPIVEILNELDRKEFSNLNDIGKRIRLLIQRTKLPENLCNYIRTAYSELCNQYTPDTDVAVRSSATAEDLPTASFAGLHESFLNVTGSESLLIAVHRCFVSLFNDRAIKYREDQGIEHMKVGLSVGVQKMVRSDLSSAGVIFTLEPESGFRDAILITGTWGLGENIVQGAVNPDEFLVFKPSLKNQHDAIIQKKLGSKVKTMVYAEHVDHQPGVSVVNIDTPVERRNEFTLDNEEIQLLAEWSMIIETHYKMPMDIEWAKDGMDEQLYIVQARPETVHSKKNPYTVKEYLLTGTGPAIVTGNAIGGKIVSGTARVLSSPAEAHKLMPGEILVTGITNPDWDPIMKKAGAIITDRGGRTSHASIVARELGLAAIVGTQNASALIHDGQVITVCCATGKTGVVYDGKLDWTEKEYDFRNVKMPSAKPMLIVGEPENAFPLSFLPSAGVGLMRMEFAISNSIRVHPMALVKFDELKDKKERELIEQLTIGYSDKKKYFVEHLSYAVAIVGAAFYPREVIVRMSDFKTNEYANLIGGKQFEPTEENPMIGFRGASRYYSDRYRDGFRLECEAILRVRNEIGLTNVKVMIPFCRTVEEGKKVLAEMETNGLKRGVNGLEVYMMTEIPSNVLLADQFAKLFDGFSIGSNDLTQLTLGIDRDNEIISAQFNERNDAPKMLIASVIKTAREAGVKIGLCGQAPSDFPEYARFLIEAGINSISFNPDALLKGIENMRAAEEDLLNRNNGIKQSQHERTKK